MTIGLIFDVPIMPTTHIGPVRSGRDSVSQLYLQISITVWVVQASVVGAPASAAGRCASAGADAQAQGRMRKRRGRMRKRWGGCSCKTEGFWKVNHIYCDNVD